VFSVSEEFLFKAIFQTGYKPCLYFSLCFNFLAVWDQKTKLFTLTINPSKTNLETIDKKLAAAGHDKQ